MGRKGVWGVILDSPTYMAQSDPCNTLITVGHISRPHSECANSVGLGNFTGFSALFAQCAKILFLWGGWGYVYIF